ncbi:unnamed protein product [Dibothriocephalus latus]|uniref:Uncharacterized protein n=1 Tax=Dibothriocephalus latus TaxID=60516 RepID=A0A3P7LG71_DIBLA|nr:unnamed protein product [Dibothriocephalus latus]
MITISPLLATELDCCVIPLRDNLKLIQTTDFFYANVDDPYTMDCAAKAGTSVRGGQTVYNPWLLIGGVATSVLPDSEFIMPNQAEAESVLVLTKPLGTQLAVNGYGWMQDSTSVWKEKLAPCISIEDLKSLYKAATFSMARLNQNGKLWLCL